jgi:NAD-dependent dihydropyrimidine dehydrogenase PreA subunit
MADKQFTLRAVPPAKSLRFDGSLCTACNRCVNVCPIDLLLPAVKGGTPGVAYPDECWFCGCCVMECPAGAVSMEHPLMNRVRWVEKRVLRGEK